MTTRTTLQKNLAFIGIFFALFFVLSFAVGSSVTRAATISRQLDVGSTGADVTTLQTFLSGNVSWYPSRLVTGYFGSLTQGGVQKFQASEGIVSSGSPTTTGYGRVGPTTLARLNTLMNPINNPPSQPTSSTVPIMSLVALQRTTSSATFTWTTNEPTIGQVYWSTSPIQSDEATGPRQTPFISGNLATANSGVFTTEHSVTVPNLQPNTLYYYVTRSIDASGDITMVINNSFMTTP